MALQKRYAAGVARNVADKNYAEAMRGVAKQFSTDGDVLTLTAEALMDLHPWDYWTKERTAKEWTNEITDMVDRALLADPMNPGANHFSIHVWEASATPERALQSCDRLASLAPGVEHLVHMPGHIYMRVGRYHDSTEANMRATEAYESYAKRCGETGLTAIGGYETHNWEFVWAGASMEGRSEVALRAADWFAKRNRNDTKIVYSRIRFGKWNDLLAMETSSDEGTGKRAAVHYGRAIAQLRANNDIGAAQAEHSALLEVLGENPRSAMHRIMRDLTAGEIAAARKDYVSAVALLEAAKVAEDSMFRSELAGWHQPVRLVLGKVLIDAGRFDEAVRAYRECLAVDIESGWALFGLAQALEAQGNTNEAARVRARFYVAWQYADVQLTSSRL
jgi:predicted Zn-dependent protease